MKYEKNIKHKPRLRLRFAETTITDVITILAGFFLVWSLFPFQHGPQLSLSCTVDHYSTRPHQASCHAPLTAVFRFFFSCYKTQHFKGDLAACTSH